MCDTLVALGSVTADGVTLFAKNSDRPPGEVQVIEWSPSRLDTGHIRTTYIEVPAWPDLTLRSLISRPAWCWGAEHGVNDAGVAIGNEAIYTRLDPRSAPAALIGMDLVRLGLERGRTAEAAVAVMVDALERHGQGGSGHEHRAKPYWSSFLVADPRDAWVLETSGTAWQAEQVHDARAITNRTTIAAFDAEHRHPRQPVDVTTDPRWRRSMNVLGRRPVTVEAVMAHLRNHDDGPWSVCMHVDDEGVEEVTTASMVAALALDGPPVVWGLTGSPCRGEYQRYEFEGSNT
jgi:secernin